MTTKLKRLIQDVKDCTLCAEHLSHGVNPVIQINRRARILIAGQAPGRIVHETGVPFDDASGKRLREWMGVSDEEFYDGRKIAILPMSFCYPGTGKTGDLAPRKECAPAWRDQLLEQLPNLELTLVLGQYAQAYHFKNKYSSVTELVKSWEKYWPDILPLPHPSPRNNVWLKKNSWFEKEVIPSLQQHIQTLIRPA